MTPEAATEMLNKHPRNAKLDADLAAARAEYLRTRNDEAYDRARYAAFAAYDAAMPEFVIDEQH